MNNELTLHQVVPFVLDCLKEYQYATTTLDVFRRHMKHVVEYYETLGYVYYAPHLFETFIAHIEEEYKLGNLSSSLFWSHRKCAYYLDEYCRRGAVKPKALTQSSNKPLANVFQDALDFYLSSLEPSIRNSTIYQRNGAIRRYLSYFQSTGHNSFESITIFDVRKFFLHLSTSVSNRTLTQQRLHIRQFHVFLNEKRIFSPNWLPFLDFKVVVPRKIQGYLSSEETESIMATIDIDTNIGKRDYAIISVARTTGLRGCDIIGLKLADIDWRLGILTVSQRKTRVTIQLPLLAETGEALKDYILNGRPKTSCCEIFVRALAPYTALSGTSSLDTILRKYEKKAHIATVPWDGKAFHGTRRGLGRNLVLAGVPVTSIMQILGQSNLDSTKPYMMLNSPELKKCALDFTNIPVKRGALQ